MALPTPACFFGLDQRDQLTFIYEVIRNLSGDVMLPTPECFKGEDQRQQATDIYEALLALSSASGITSVDTGHTLWVDAVFGDNNTGTREDQVKQYLDPQGAKADALSGDTIAVRPASYTITADLATNGVNWTFDPVSTLTWNDDTVGTGIFDDGGAEMHIVIDGGARIRRIANFPSVVTNAVLVSHANSDFRITADEIAFSEDPGSEGPVGSAVNGTAGVLYVRARRIIASGSSGFAWGVWWKNGDDFIEADLIKSDSYGVISDCNSAPTGDLQVVAKRIEAGFPVVTTGTNATAACWIEAQIVKGSSGQSMSIQGANKTYVTCQKIFGAIVLNTTAGLLYVKANKISANVNGTAVSPAMFNSSVASADSYIEIDHWDAGTFTGDMIKVSAGVVRISGMNYTASANSKGIEITGGTMILENCRIDTTANAATNPILFTGGTLIVGSGTWLKAQGARDSVETNGAALTIYANSAFANNNVDGAATIIGDFQIAALP